MKILQLCNKPPYPAVDGGCIAMNNITMGLINKGHEVKVLTISTNKHPFDISNYSEHYLEKTHIDACYVDTRVNIIDAFAALVTSDSYNVSRFFTPDFDQLLIKTLDEGQFDIVHIESLFMTPYIGTIRKFSKAKVILRSHNLEHLIWERLASSTKNKAKRLYLKHLAKKLKHYEKSILPELDGIAAITKEDYNRYQKFEISENKLFTIPFGIDLENYAYKKYAGNGLQYFHLGSMNWNPNIEAVNWLLEVVWPFAQKKNKKIQLSLAGRDLGNEFDYYSSSQIRIDGEVENAHEYLQNNGIMLVPLLSGGGMRVKIIEGMALGCPIITTSIGIEGIEAKNEKHVLIANTKDEFRKAIEKLRDNPDLGEELSSNARKLVEKKYDNKKIVEHLIKHYNSL